MKEINANMAGTVLNVLVNKGEGVSPGQLVVVLESMKMEIPIESTIEGTVTDIKVGIGDFVNEGDTLVILT
ncbi:biotin/lipoyl-containing protein [Fictibacillus sp. Mic-4]|uniref:biotin/lipoyl-containing protein n=1 Tax=Fictibacillus sp. Mic-4 TaxID=3132826 RepID=UPI003CF13974